MPENQITESDFREIYQKEYDIVATSWRFFISLRFIVIAFTVTLQSALFTLYSRFPPEQAKGVFHLYYIFIPLLGILTVLATSIIEKRNIKHFQLLIRRGIELEFHLGIQDGHFRRIYELQSMIQKGMERFQTHTWGIRIIYFALYGIWIFLFLTAIVSQKGDHNGQQQPKPAKVTTRTN